MILLKTLQDSLKRYRQGLKANPKSTFYHGLVKNTKEYIKEIKKQSITNNKKS